VLHEKYRGEREIFVAKYLQFLEAGNTLPPEQLLARLGVDINDPFVWQRGFDAISEMIDELESLA
jgi:oligoendopeptidase F